MTQSGGAAIEQVDIAIVGGGMVGASLALLLSALQPHWKILVVEAFAVAPAAEPGYRPSFDARSTALSHSTREIFEQLGLWEALSRHAASINEVHVSDRGHVGSTRLAASEQGLPALGVVVENQWLGSVLMATLRCQPQIELVSPARLEAVKAVPGGMQFELSGSDVSAHYHCSLLVVADGAQSETREKLGISVSSKDYGKTALIANLSLEQPHQGVAYERFTDQGPMALLPLTNHDDSHRSALVWTLSPARAEQLRQCSEAEFVAELQQRFGYRLGQFQCVGERFCFPLKLVESAEQVRRNLVVIGNAAHALHPVAGQGFNLSLRDAAMLAEVLAEAGQRGECLGELSVLQQYLERQRNDQRQTITLSDMLPGLFGLKSAPVALARNIGLLALDAVPALRNQFARVGMGLDARRSDIAKVASSD